MSIEYFNWSDTPKHAEQVMDISGSYYLCHKHYPGHYFVIEGEKYQDAVIKNTLSELPPPHAPRWVSPFIFDDGDNGWYIHEPTVFDWLDFKIIHLVSKPEELE